MNESLNKAEEFILPFSYPPASKSTKSSKTTMSWKPFKNGITSLTVDIPQSKPSVRSASATYSNSTARREPRPSVSKWRTKEFCLYYAVFVIAVPYMIKSAVDLSKESHPNYHHFSHRLKNGWMFGWKVDTSDHQWNVFRSNLPMLSGLILLWCLASFLFQRYISISSTSSTKSSPRTLQQSVNQRVTFILLFSLPLLTILHGSSLPKMLVILLINFSISRMARFGGRWTKMAPFAGWGFNLAVLFGNEIYGGYKWEAVHESLTYLDADSLKGILPRWHINWNITMLRLISFNMDYYWACTTSSVATPIQQSKFSDSPVEIDDRIRTTRSHSLASYSLPIYLAYALYPPLYLAGPILTYNSFLSQLVSPPTISLSQMKSYGMRFVACLLTMELVLHSMYVVAIKDSSREGAWMGDTPFELSMIGFWNLIVVWLKLLIPWRFFRLWALLDGINPPENMVRCMANNYSTLGFWRSWHRSYNLWVVRYLYVPFGGGTNAILSTLSVFTFVALWHDLSLKLLTWGWVISLFVLPEMAARKFIPYEIYGPTFWYRHLAAVGGVINVLMMMTANLIGFAIGTEGMSYMWGKMVGTPEGIKFMTVASGCLFVAVQFMFEYREEEKRRGISRRC